MSSQIIIWPIILPLLTAIATLFAWQKIRIQRGLSLASMAGYLMVAVLIFSEAQSDNILVVQIGAWDAPFGISLVADRLSAMMILLVAIVGSATIVFSTANVSR